MKKIKLKIPAKLNLTLDVLGKKGNYHLIESLVTSVDIYDEIIIKKRKDKQVRLYTKGIYVDCPLEKNNAFITAKYMQNKFSLTGMSITVKKNIPVGGGMGGSSADIAGVIKGVNILFNLNCDTSKIATELGSDVNYMLSGGYAVMRGRGEKVEFFDSNRLPLYFILARTNKSVSAKNCYNLYDNLQQESGKKTPLALEALKKNNIKALISSLGNDLFSSAKILQKEIGENCIILSKLAPASMTGSGSVTFAVFLTKKERDKAYKKLSPLFKIKLLKAKNNI